MDLQRVKQELSKKGATERDAESYIVLARDFVERSKTYDGTVNPHHLLPRQCGWWRKFGRCKWNLAPVAWQLHVSLHAQLCFMFPLNRKMRRGLNATTVQPEDEMKLRNKDRIMKWYVDECRDAPWIAQQLGRSNTVILIWLHNWGVTIRPRGSANRHPKQRCKDQIIKWYKAGRSSTWIAKRIGASTGVLKWLRKWGVTMRSNSGAHTNVKKSKYKDDILAWYAKGRCPSWIAKQIGMGDNTVRRWLQEWGVTLRPIGTAHTSAQKSKCRDRIIKWYAAGHGSPWIAKRVGMDSVTIINWLREWGVTIRHQPRSPRPHRFKLDAKRIVSLYRQGKSPNKIALLLGNARPVIRQILVREGVYQKDRDRNLINVERAVTMYKQGQSIAEIARALQRTTGGITQVLKRAGVLLAAQAAA
jgi:transposase